jgi:hypothetical protein
VGRAQRVPPTRHTGSRCSVLDVKTTSAMQQVATAAVGQPLAQDSHWWDSLRSAHPIPETPSLVKGWFVGCGLVFCSSPQAEDRATQGCDPSVAWGPRAEGPALPCEAGPFFCGRVAGFFGSACGFTAINPIGSASMWWFGKTNNPCVLRQPWLPGRKIGPGRPPDTTWVCGPDGPITTGSGPRSSTGGGP